MISYLEDKKIFTLSTDRSTYQMKVLDGGFLIHLYYGSKISGTAEQVAVLETNSFCPSPSEDFVEYSQNSLLMEYSFFGSGDYRTSCIKAIFPDGSRTLDLRYESHRIFSGKPKLNGLPATYFEDDSAESLEIVLKDTVYDIRVALLYTVARNTEAILRSAKIINNEDFDLFIDTALSGCLDFNNSNFDIIRFMGRTANERQQCRTALTQGMVSAESTQGISSHSANPFVIVCEHDANEKNGECYGMSLVYSGNFTMSAYTDPTYRTRLVCGINPDCFEWKLGAGDNFQTPEMILSYSNEGFGLLSKNFHGLYRENLCRGPYKNLQRPIVLNSWEAVLFDFNSDKLLDMARIAKETGIEMLVIDDGWFGKRDWDDSSLGDWFANEKKLGGSLAQLVQSINNLGLKVGLWFEPEMISKNSDLFRNHPEWLMHCPNREPAIRRSQYLLDMSRKEVTDYIYDCISEILKTTNIEYIKWDFNRPITDIYSEKLPSDQQGEVSHRYMLGVYDLLERLTTEFPNVLFEGCASGGGRFDAGMLYYQPQIWCSDNTDAVDRLFIQYDTSFGYPLSTISAHVCPTICHQTECQIPLTTRGTVAMTGAFGYELDITTLGDEEIEEIKKQVKFYKEYREFILNADYHRLTNPYTSNVVAWEYVNKNKSLAIVCAVQKKASANGYPVVIRLCDLEADGIYNVSLNGEMLYEKLTGSSLMNAGILINQLKGDYNAYTYTVEKIQNGEI